MNTEPVKRKGIEIVKQNSSPGVTIIGGQIKIEASTKAIETNFIDYWGQVYMIIDCSGSMFGYKLEQIRVGVLEFAKDAIGKEYKTGLIKFDSLATHLSEPTRDINTLSKCLKSLDASGTTNMVNAIEMAYKKLKNLECSRVMVIATDGQPDDQKATIKIADLAKNDGVEIITIGTDDADQRFLKKLASRDELGTKVSSDLLAKTISSAYKMLPDPRTVILNKHNK